MIHAHVEVDVTSIPDNDPIDRLLAPQVNFPPGTVLHSGMSIGIAAVIPDRITIHSAFRCESTLAPAGRLPGLFPQRDVLVALKHLEFGQIDRLRVFIFRTPWKPPAV